VTDLLRLVQTELLPQIEKHGFKVTTSEASDSFDNASVVLQAPELRLRVVRERSQVFADIGPVAEPSTWFDSAVVMDDLGLSSNAGFHDRDQQKVLQGLASFLNAMWGELRARFASDRLAKTKQELQRLKEIRAQRMFGE
jgi:hypothetical protein